MLGRIAFRRSFARCPRGFSGLLGIGFTEVPRRDPGGARGCHLSCVLLARLRSTSRPDSAREVPYLSVLVGLAALRFGAVNSTPSPFRAVRSFPPSWSASLTSKLSEENALVFRAQDGTDTTRCVDGHSLWVLLVVGVLLTRNAQLVGHLLLCEASFGAYFADAFLCHGSPPSINVLRAWIMLVRLALRVKCKWRKMLV